MKNPFESGDVRVTSPYGMRDGEFHKGIDLVGTSSTRIVAVEDAEVAVSNMVTDRNNKTWEWGNYVRLDLADGRRLYHCHLSKRLVRAGERVKKGQVIGIMGDTGKAYGAHLHWEIRPRGFSTESLDISEYSGIPNRRGVYDAESDAPISEETLQEFEAEDSVTLVEGAVYTNGVRVPSQYIGKPFTVLQTGVGRVLIRELYSWVENRYVKKAKETKEPNEEREIKVGDRVRILKGAVYSNGVRVPNRYLGETFTVLQLLGGRVLVKEINSWVKREFVERV